MWGWMGSNKTTISVTMATGELKLIHTLKQRVSNNKHPPYKYANQAYLLQWVGSREGWWQTTHQWMSFSSDNGWILENESTLQMKQEAQVKAQSWFKTRVWYPTESPCQDVWIYKSLPCLCVQPCLLCISVHSGTCYSTLNPSLDISHWRLERGLWSFGVFLKNSSSGQFGFSSLRV